MTLFSYQFKAYQYFLLCGFLWVSQDGFAAHTDDGDVFSYSPGPFVRSVKTPQEEADHVIRTWKEKTLKLRSTSGFSANHVIIIQYFTKLIGAVNRLRGRDAASDESLSLAQKEAESLYTRINETVASFEETIEGLRPDLIQLLSERNSLQRKRRGATSRFSPF